MKRLLVALITFSVCVIQAQNLDSLSAALSGTEGSERAELLLQLAEGYASRDWDQSIHHATEAQELVEDQPDPELKFRARYTLAKAWQGKGDYIKALDHGKIALKLAETYIDQSKIQTLLGLIYESLSEYEVALTYHLEALRLRESIGDQELMANSMVSIAYVYRGMRQFEKALGYLDDARAVFRALGVQKGVSKCTFSIGLMTMEMDRHAEAIPIFREAMRGMDQAQEPYIFSTYYNNLANCYQRLLSNEHADYYDSALIYGHKNLVLKVQIKDLRGIANAHNNLAATYERASEYDSSYYHSSEALRLADSLGFLPIKKNALLYLVTAEIMLGKKRSANDRFEEFVDTYETLMDQQYSRTLSDMATKYETGKKEAENALLLQQTREQTRVTLYLGAAGILLIVVVLVLVALFKMKQKANAQLQADKRVIEEQRRKLAEINDLKSQFFASISHELRTPLTIIQGNVEEGLKNPKLSMKDEERLKHIRRNTRQLTDMVSDLLDLSKFELQHYQVHPEPTDMVSLLGRIRASFSSLAESKSIQLDFSTEAGSPIGLVDPNQFEKVMNNLIHNAFKFTRKGNKIEIVLAKAADQLNIRVRDTGRGIPASDLPHIFDRFYQGRNELAAGVGTGLGLAIAKELTVLMKGSIEVASTLGEGTTFTVSIPATTLAPVIAHPEQVSAEHAADYLEEGETVLRTPLKIPSGITVMVVEDNEVLREFISRIMMVHFQVIVAENGRHALELLKTTAPDLILTDLMMPEMDGWQLIENLKTQPNLAQIPVILLTAIGGSEHRLKGLRLGVDDYIQKPFATEELLIRITNLVNNLRERVKWAQEMGNEPKPDLSEQHDLIVKIKDYVLENISEKSMNVLQLAMHLGTSERQLYRKTQEATGLQPGKLILEVKLQHARELLLSKKVTKVSQVASAVGFDSAGHFSKLYFQRFGKKPSDYLR